MTDAEVLASALFIGRFIGGLCGYYVSYRKYRKALVKGQKDVEAEHAASYDVEESTAVGESASPFAKAPYYGQLAKDKWNHFILLVKAWTSLEDGSLLDHLAETCNEFFDRHNELHELG